MLKNILLIGGSGTLGSAILNSEYFSQYSILAPSRKILDITEPETIQNFFEKNEIDFVIDSSGLARMKKCEEYPTEALKTNIIGTSNLVMEVMRKETSSGKTIRFVHISTDGVYPGTRGNYSEKDETMPYNKYGWTKLGEECTVHLLQNFCIIRTSFFDSKNIRFDCSPTDAYFSKVKIDYLVKAIYIMLNQEFIGTINIGGEKKSYYKLYKEFKPSLKSCKFDDVLKDLSFPMARDSSLNSELWKKIKNGYSKNVNKSER